MSSLILWLCIITNEAFGDQQSAGAGLYGITPYPYGPALNKYDIESGTMTVLTNFTGGWTSPDISCFDDRNNILYYAVGIWKAKKVFVSGLYGWNLSDLTKSPGFIELPQIYTAEAVDPTSSGQQCVGGTNGNIYFWGQSAANHSQLLLLNIYRNESNDLVIDTLATYSGINDYAYYDGAFPNPVFDPKRNKFWIAGFKHFSAKNYTQMFFYIDASSGNIEKEISRNDWPFDAAAYDAKLDLIVGFDFIEFEPDENVAYVLNYADPVTLEVQKTSDEFKEWCYDLAGTIDNDNQMWYQFIYNGTKKHSDEAKVCGKSTKTTNYIVAFNLTSAQMTGMATFGTNWDEGPDYVLFYWDGK